MTTLFIEATVIGMAARPLGEWKRGPLIRLFETQASGDLREDGEALYSNRALLVAEGLRAEGHTLRIFGTRDERTVLGWLEGRGFSVVEATVPRLVESTPLALISPWLATVASRGRAPHNIRAHFTTATQLGLGGRHVADALRMPTERTAR
jgi:hypothetical protein